MMQARNLHFLWGKSLIIIVHKSKLWFSRFVSVAWYTPHENSYPQNIYIKLKNNCFNSIYQRMFGFLKLLSLHIDEVKGNAIRSNGIRV